MNCAWKELTAVLPPWIRDALEEGDRDHLQELRLRVNSAPELIGAGGFRRSGGMVTEQDLWFIVNAASKYSPWSAASTEQGYLTAPGGHRIGLCGESVCREGGVRIRRLTSVCIRVARDFPGIAGKLREDPGSVLILGAPGAGKTTLLRDLCRRIAKRETVCVVDERQELYPEGFARGERMDVLSGCSKALGIEMLLRTMGPQYIAVDEITAEEDTRAILRSSGCGVRLLATAHASCREELLSRSVYRPLIEGCVFDTLVFLRADRTWREERGRL